MKRSYHSNLAFLDLLFNALLCFAALFVIALLLINPKEKREGVIVKAEFLITVTWPHNIHNDVDTYVEDPVGNLVFFKSQEEGLMHLDRDDIGIQNDKIATAFGDVYYRDNREIVTIRGSVSGEYIVNVHLYSKNEDVSVPVTVQVDKINPFSTVFLDTVVLTVVGDEKTACRFMVSNEGNVLQINRLQKSLTTNEHYGF